MGSIYVWIVDGTIIRHTDLDAAAELDGLSRPPDRTITEKEFSASGGLIRLINGEIVLGKTDEERAHEEARERIAEIDASFPVIEQKMIRPMLAHALGTENEEDANKLGELSNEINALRTERRELELSLI